MSWASVDEVDTEHEVRPHGGDHRVEMRGQIRHHPSAGAVVTGVRAHIEQRDNFAGRFAENAGADERVDQTG